MLGHGESLRQCGLPTAIAALKNVRVVHVACGWDHSLAVSSSGELYTWGAGHRGKLGHGDEAAQLLPKRVEALAGQRVVMAEAGCEHTAAVTQAGDLYTWGQGDGGRLGHGPPTVTSGRAEPAACLQPRRVEALVAAGLRVTALAVGDKYNLILVKPRAAAVTTGARQGPPAESRSAEEEDGQGGELPPPTLPWPLLRWQRALDSKGPVGCMPAALSVLLELERLSGLGAEGMAEEQAVADTIVRRIMLQQAARGSSPAGGEQHPLVRRCLRKPMGLAYARLLHRPYAVDASCSAVCRTLLAMLKEASAGLLGPSKSSCEEKAAALGHRTQARARPAGPQPLAAWVLCWVCLRLLRSSVRSLVYRGLILGEAVAGTGDAVTAAEPLSAAKARPWLPQEDDPAQPTPPRRQARRKPAAKLSLADLRALLLQLCCRGEMGLGFVSEEEERSAVQLLRQEAGAVLLAGFSLFYPDPPSRATLLRDLSQPAGGAPGDGPGLLVQVLANRLVQDEVMAPLVCHLASSGPRQEGTSLREVLSGLLSRCCEHDDGAPAMPQLLDTLRALHMHTCLWLTAAVSTASSEEEQVGEVRDLLVHHFARAMEAACALVAGSPSAWPAFVTQVVPVLLVAVSALPSRQLAGFSPHVPLVMALMRAVRAAAGQPHDEQQQHNHQPATAPADQLLSAATLFVSRVACDLAFSPAAAQQGPALDSLHGCLMQSEACRASEEDLLAATDGAVLVELRNAARAWKKEATGAKAQAAGREEETGASREDEEGGWDPSESQAMAPAPRAPLVPRTGSRSRLPGLPSPHSSSPAPHLAAPARPSTAGSTASSSSKLQQMVEAGELEVFLQELAQGTGQGQLLDLHVSAMVGEAAAGDATSSGSSKEDVVALLSTTGRLLQPAEQPPAVVKRPPVQEGAQSLRRMLIVLLLKSHRAGQQAVLLAKCLPRTPGGSPVVATPCSTASRSDVPPLLLAIWRTAALVHANLKLLAQSMQPSGAADDADKGGCCTDHPGSCCPEACWVSNLAFLLQAGTLEPISLAREDPAELLHRTVRRVARAYPRADPKVLARVLGVLDGWRRRYERQQQAGEDSPGLQVLGDLSPESVPLHHVLAFVFLPCPARKQVVAQLSQRHVASELCVEGLSLLSRLLGEAMPDGPALFQLLRTYTSAALQHFSSTTDQKPPTPHQAQGFTSACLQLYKRLNRLLRTTLVQLQRDQGGEGAAPATTNSGSTAHDRLITVLLALSVTLLLLKNGIAGVDTSRDDGGRPTILARGLVTTQPAAQEQLASSSPLPWLAMTLRLRLIPLLSDILSGPANVVTDETSPAAACSEWLSMLRDAASSASATPASRGGEGSSTLWGRAWPGDAAAAKRLEELQQQPSSSQQGTSPTLRLHEASWGLLSLVISLLADLSPADDHLKRSSSRLLLDASARGPSAPLQRGASFSNINLSPALAESGPGHDPLRPASASIFRRTSSLSSSSGSSSLSRDSAADEETEMGVLCELASSELHRLVPPYSRVLRLEAAILELLSRHRAQLVTRRPPLPYSAALDQQRAFAPPSPLCGQLLQLQDLDDNHHSFSVSFWILRPVHQRPRASTARRVLLFARALEVAFPSQVSDMPNQLDKMVELPHPGVFLTDDEQPSLEFSVLVPAAATEPGSPVRRAASGAQQDQRGVATGEEEGEGEEDNERAEMAVEVQDSLAPGTRARAAVGQAKRYKRVALSVAMGQDTWPAGTWAHVCCSYASSYDSATEGQLPAAPRASMRVFVNGREVGCRQGLKGHAVPPLCTDMVLAFAGKDEGAHAARPGGHIGLPAGTCDGHEVRLVDLCYFQQAVTADVVKEAHEAGSFSSCSHRRKSAGRYACRLLHGLQRMLRHRACVQELATYPWVFFLLKLLKIGELDMQLAVLRLLRTLLPAVRTRRRPTESPATCMPLRRLSRMRLAARVVAGWRAGRARLAGLVADGDEDAAHAAPGPAGGAGGHVRDGPPTAAARPGAAGQRLGSRGLAAGDVPRLHPARGAARLPPSRAVGQPLRHAVDCHCWRHRAVAAVGEARDRVHGVRVRVRLAAASALAMPVVERAAQCRGRGHHGPRRGSGEGDGGGGGAQDRAAAHGAGRDGRAPGGREGRGPGLRAQ